MKSTAALVLLSCLVASAANAQGESMTFPNTEKCTEIVSDIKKSTTPEQLAELMQFSANGISNSMHRFVTGRDSIIGDLQKQFGETALYMALDEPRKKLDASQISYWSDRTSHNESLLSKGISDFYAKNPGLKSKGRDLTICTAVFVYTDKNVDSKAYSAITKISPRAGRFGHFDISVKGCTIGSSVGTKNEYSEPDKWEGSQFVVVDALYKNMDREGRLPFEGSLIIKTSTGEELRYDNTETIMSEGYGIYFKSVNPLVTMPTKIAYRIPTDIEGEILWEPGRNEGNKRLWCAFINPDE